jgi:hypothetical protein
MNPLMQCPKSSSTTTIALRRPPWSAGDTVGHASGGESWLQHDDVVAQRRLGAGCTAGQ